MNKVKFWDASHRQRVGKMEDILQIGSINIFKNLMVSLNNTFDYKLIK